MSGERAIDLKGLRALVSDVDGVMNDGRVLFSGSGDGKFFHIRDGLAIKAAMELGFEVALLSGRDSETTRKRAAELKIRHVMTGRLDKQNAFGELLDRLGYEANQVAYVGDDLPDLAPLAMAGLACCPSDAVAEVQQVVDLVIPVAGGRGVLRWLLEHILRSQNRWAAVVDHFSFKSQQTP
jgi:3-deoxy-D-manno-octulosonate 8-phosphate phosphatase (KDO 8-P phosphatase)